MKKAQGISMNVIIISAIMLLVLVILVAIFSGNFGNNQSTEKWVKEEICVGYAEDNASRTMSAGEIEIGMYMNYLYENPDAEPRMIHVIVNEKSTDMLNITLSRVEYTIDGTEMESIDEIIFPCQLKDTVKVKR